MNEQAWKPILSMLWKHLLFAHWRVPPDTLRPLLPEPLQIDTYEGAAWGGLVHFVMEVYDDNTSNVRYSENSPMLTGATQQFARSNRTKA